MGTTAQKLQKILDSKDAIKVAINNRGGTINDTTPLSEYATQVDNLPSGEQDNSILHSILNRNITEVNDSVFSDYYGSYIGEGAFYRCKKLTSVSISNQRIRNIGINAFGECTNLSSVNIPYVTSIDASAFSSCSSIESIDLSNISQLSNSVFSHCSNLKNITLGNKITSLYYGTFQYCTSLQSISIPKNITSIGGSCFYYCPSFSQINFEEGSSLKEIGVSAFFSCALVNIEIPSSVVTISSDAFSGCSSLRQIVFKGVTPPTFGTDVFRNCTSLLEIRVPSESVEAYKTALGTYADLVIADQ